MFVQNLLLILTLMFLNSNSAFAAQLTYGKYFGTIQMNGRTEVMAVSLDAFVTQINDPTVYPEMNVIVRVNLGGYLSSEYVGYHFYDPTFNFENSVLQLNDPKNELTATLQVTTTDTQTILDGPITYRPTNAKGTMHVAMDLNNLRITKNPRADAPVLSVLSGEYLGTCGTEPADLQIETSRGLGDNTPGNALAGFSITGRLGYTHGPLCSAAKGHYCSEYPLSKGIYYLFDNRLTMQGPLATMDCKRTGDSLQCTVQGQGKTEACTLSKMAIAPTGPSQIPTGIYLNVPSDQKKPLPDPLPPGNDDLVSALNGDFYGFLHYENRDQYQLMEMSVVSSTSTENPHVQNQVLVEPTISLRLSSSWDSTPVYTTIFPQRVFYMNPGFAFQSDGDNFVVIGQWRKGYVSGVWYSRAYGRVGTFEMQKGSPPSAPSKMMVIPNCFGQFQGPSDAPDPLKNVWSIDVEALNQTSGLAQNSVQLIGRYQLQNPASSVQMFDAASLDLNTGALNFLIKKPTGDRLITGQIVSDQKFKLLWPVGPALGAPMDAYSPFTYNQIATH